MSSHPVVAAKEIDDVSLPDGSSFTSSGGTILFTDKPSDTEPPARTEGAPTIPRFTDRKPSILYIVGYDSEDQGTDFDGLILVIKDDTKDLVVHGIEIWRREKFTDDAFINLGTISFRAMEAERNALKDYLQLKLGTYDQDNWLVFYDNDMDNRLHPGIYEYKIRMVKYPSSFDFDLSDVIDIEELPKEEIDNSWNGFVTDEEGSPTALEALSLVIYDAIDYDWIIALLNPEINFFTSDQQALIDIINGMQSIRIAKNLDDVTVLLQQLIMQYGIVATIEKIVEAMGELNISFLTALIKALEKSFNALEPSDLMDGDPVRLPDFSRIVKAALDKQKFTTTSTTVPVVVLPEGGLIGGL